MESIPLNIVQRCVCDVCTVLDTNENSSSDWDRNLTQVEKMPSRGAGSNPFCMQALMFFQDLNVSLNYLR